ncbi:hypothetical protein [Roseibium aggregatum]|uniref:Periplasmic protein-like protein n=1 Tax=Roseibium aggregatum TaxID=187304 RepID=A0A939J6A9_9HYPH|nr:hypothetical protein [Roseibium aggregatum]MBN9673080.1 hypothetical protein [Roseibium aggregatum]
MFDRSGTPLGARVRIVAWFLAGLVFGGFAPEASAQDPFDSEMTFENVCAGNSAASCYIRAVGTISKDTPQAFQKYLDEDHSDGNKVLLHSPGGSLLAGLKLGELIRARGLETRVGVWKLDGNFGEVSTGGVCASACAYVFLGGTVRQVPEGNRLGFHQFYLSAPRAGEVSAAKLETALMQAQELSSVIVRYLLEMDIDARIFVLGSEARSDDMFYPDREQLLAFSLVTPRGFGEFFLEPYKDGLVAAAKRKGETRLYDVAKQLTAYCRDSMPYLLITADNVVPDSYVPDTMLFFATESGTIKASVGDKRIRRAGNQAYEILLSREAVELLGKSLKFRFSLFLAMADGGEIRGELELSDMDRRILEASYRFCIS